MEVHGGLRSASEQNGNFQVSQARIPSLYFASGYMGKIIGPVSVAKSNGERSKGFTAFIQEYMDTYLA